jgi:ABC-type glycerol-3-phosphate transport system substrate-binding protein
MYEMTGLPGWVRFGCSPGWVGRSRSGMGPCAEYLMSGSWPTPAMNAAWAQGCVPYPVAAGFPMPGFPTPYDPWGATVLTPEQELAILKEEARELAQELASLEEKIRGEEGGKS